MHSIAVGSCDPLCFYREPNRLSEVCSDMEENSEAIGEDGRRAENHQMSCIGGTFLGFYLCDGLIEFIPSVE